MMLYSPSQYGGITAQTNTSHLMHDDAFCDSLPPAVSNPSGGATLQTALSCITGNKKAVKKSCPQRSIFTPGFHSSNDAFSHLLYICVHVEICRIWCPQPDTGSAAWSRHAGRGFLQCDGPLHQPSLLHLYRGVILFKTRHLFRCTVLFPAFHVSLWERLCIGDAGGWLQLHMWCLNNLWGSSLGKITVKELTLTFSE